MRCLHLPRAAILMRVAGFGKGVVALLSLWTGGGDLGQIVARQTLNHSTLCARVMFNPDTVSSLWQRIPADRAIFSGVQMVDDADQYFGIEAADVIIVLLHQDAVRRICLGRNGSGGWMARLRIRFLYHGRTIKPRGLRVPWGVYLTFASTIPPIFAVWDAGREGGAPAGGGLNLEQATNCLQPFAHAEQAEAFAPLRFQDALHVERCAVVFYLHADAVTRFLDAHIHRAGFRMAGRAGLSLVLRCFQWIP